VYVAQKLKASSILTEGVNKYYKFLKK